MLRPREDQEKWCSVFVLHQNRVDRGPKIYIAEEMLPDFLDLVIWGHEHECKITPEWNDRCQFYVCQPGRYIAFLRTNHLGGDGCGLGRMGLRDVTVYEWK
jgi:double-strand break repair protein MRE11